MSREIKLRAWNSAEQGMYQNVGIIPSEEGYKAADSIGGLIHDMYGSQPAVMQYTGLKDKNGHEIYEGDIVRDARWDQLFEVQWCDGKGEFLGSQVGWIINDEKFCPVGHVDGLAAYLEWREQEREEYFNGVVVGNIYENSELLEVAKE